MKKRWYSFSAKDTGVVEISIFDEIGFWGTTARDFKREFDEVKDSDSIVVSLNSPGGGFFDGIAIYQMLSSVRDKVSVEVYGLAASIASVIALSGKSLTIARGSYFMIHNPFTLAMGGAKELRDTAEILDKMQGDLANLYAGKTGMTTAEITALMDAETWYTADEAYEAGFADEVSDYGEVAARVTDIQPFNFSNTPQALLEKQTKDDIKTERQFERLLRDAGFSRTDATAIVKHGFRAVQGEPESTGGQGEPVQTRTELLRATLVKSAKLWLESKGVGNA
jgi:ATP-dependent Clp protease, protease subunit